MIIIMKPTATREHVEQLTAHIERWNVKANPIFGKDQIVIGLVGDTTAVDKDALLRDPEVDNIIKVQEPFKLANRKFHPDDTAVTIGKDVVVGGKKIVVMAGPCSVEGHDQIIDVARHVQADGAAVLRGGAWKPRSSPYSFQGMKAEGLELLHEASLDTGLPVVTEITNPAHIDLFMEKCDCFQVGARNMQNFELLKELGQTNKPVLLKRGFANTMEEFLMSAEYLMAGGNENVILCERGIRTYETYTRNTLDISAVPVLKRMSHLPVIVDPSHAGGIYWMVEPLAKAAVAAGADGLMIEVHNDPARALSDGAQSLTYDSFHETMNSLRAVAAAVGREL
ncbi:MAG: 3-deoxy-7-phosphoheptulonate synthase [Eubacteriales bacterium]|nr:3-deoxy-7-phosphoheptulonate synthase [Eubacteriales bacterium]